MAEMEIVREWKLAMAKFRNPARLTTILVRLMLYNPKYI